MLWSQTAPIFIIGECPIACWFKACQPQNTSNICVTVKKQWELWSQIGHQAREMFLCLALWENTQQSQQISTTSKQLETHKLPWPCAHQPLDWLMRRRQQPGLLLAKWFCRSVQTLQDPRELGEATAIRQVRVHIDEAFHFWESLTWARMPHWPHSELKWWAAFGCWWASCSHIEWVVSKERTAFYTFLCCLFARLIFLVAHGLTCFAIFVRHSRFVAMVSLQGYVSKLSFNKHAHIATEDNLNIIDVEWIDVGSQNPDARHKI